ncbi:hypothetical protein FKG94_25155 [Exilibacterium tricleocarpae]|uniref:Uncharacterized protein n=1 Tax=Exilibacterium tricleocarpae TaxID=2591008 RepID=A0A545SRS2_9GAMM|nr:hypothetical protein [Exilibacterium tricleocarpae]TQV67664.1 hypothetical protein FKG94_25155 [Exilibacterium tricleocarpae]
MSTYAVEFDGIVSRRFVSVGTKVKSDDPLIEVISTTEKQIVFDIVRDEINFLPSELTAVVQGRTTRIETDRVKIFPVKNNDVVALQGIVILDNSRFFVGEVAEVTLQYGFKEPMYELPKSLVHKLKGYYQIHLVDELSMVRSHQVDIIQESALFALVKFREHPPGKLAVISHTNIGNTVNIVKE